MMNWNSKTTFRSIAVALGVSALLVPALSFAEQPEIDCQSLDDSAQEQFYNLSGQAQQAVEEGDFDSALKFSLDAMNMCTSDAYTEYTLARIYQLRNECASAFYHLNRLNARIKAIKAEDKQLASSITKYFKEAKDQCGDAVPVEITCTTDGTMIQLVGALDTPRACPVYTAIVPGAYQLNATKETFFPHKDTVTVSAESGLTYSVPELQDADDFGELRVKCPRGAIKFVLTDSKGIVNEYACPWEGKLPSGSYKLRLGGENATETEVFITKHQQTESVLESNAARANCSSSPVSAQTGFGALILAALGAFGLASIRRRRED